MPKAGQVVEVNTFVKGLITEASPLNFPANASKDEVNFELNVDGSRDRRFGMDFESPSTQRSPTNGFDLSTGLGTYRWGSVGGLSDKEFLVVQVGKWLYFFDALVANISYSGLISTLELTSFSASSKMSFASVHGKLVVVGGISRVGVVEYNSTTQTFAVTYHNILVRDAWGIEVKDVPSYETDAAFRSATESQNHNYNLWNQSWGVPRRSKDAPPVEIPYELNQSPAAAYHAGSGLYPSNSENVWTGIIYTAGASGADPYESLVPSLYVERIGADTIAAKGYFIIDLLARGQSRSVAVLANSVKFPTMPGITPTIPADSTAGGATIVTEFAGRVFYAGFSGDVYDGDLRSPNLSNFVVFSSLVESPRDVVTCYQKGDPTSRETPEIVDTDGGFIRISGAKNIIAMEHIGSALVVIADNGVWVISGGSDYGFSATNYKVAKVTNNGGSSKASVVRDGSSVLYWASDAIYVVAPTQTGEFTATSITTGTIQKLYNNITSTSKRSVIGLFDTVNRKARWVYKDADNITDKELILDTVLGAFYQHTIANISTDAPKIYGLFSTASFGMTTGTADVLSGGDAVLSSVDAVVVPTTSRAAGLQSTKYLTVTKIAGAYKFAFSSYSDVTFSDWKSYDGVGVDAKAYMETGAQTAGNSSLDKQIPYLTMHFRRTESSIINGVVQNQSSCKVKSMWDWGNKAGYSVMPLFQTYRYNKPYIPLTLDEDYPDDYEVLTSKNKLRGRGKAFSMYMETEPLKDCRILGWSVTLNGNTIV